ncbi:MAG: hypothetical protein HOP33_23130 [Verrucomicrobia bacterium]|nr:hypothetical protein [Verrucomicrobiota bacterium]
MKIIRHSFSLVLSLSLLCLHPIFAQDTNTVQVFTKALNQLVEIVNPPADAAPRTFTTTLKILKADGLPKELVGREIALAFQSPDHVRVAAKWEGEDFVLGRNVQELWVYAAGKRFGVVGKPGVARFSNVPDSKDNSVLAPIKLPVDKDQLAIVPMLMKLVALPNESIGGSACRVIKATLMPEAIEAFKLPDATIQVWIRESDSLLTRVSYRQGKTDVEVELQKPQFVAAWPAEKWQLKAGAGEVVETVAQSHVSRFLEVSLAMLGQKIPTLGPATGERRVLAREGDGRLEMIDGTRVLHLKGTPEEMGRQHGTLLKKEIADLVEHMLFGVGVGSSFEKGRWFFGEIESAQTRLMPYTDPRYVREMDSMALAAGLPREELRVANFFPELFHCSGFALFGKATEGGKMYHGRILDYIRGLGLEQNAMVIVMQPDQGNAWVNISYAGFVGSVTAMNEKHISIGEMGGRGEGNWDGKPMAQLVREVMEKANTLDEAVAIMRKGPRTCEYYYVIADAKTKSAVGIAATPTKFEVIKPGETHPMLPHGIQDSVLMSAGDRYEELARRVKTGHGKFDAESARDLMKRPVCMTSNIHSVLFEPESLDFWVAIADSKNPAAHARYTHYNLAELLKPEKTQ